MEDSFGVRVDKIFGSLSSSSSSPSLPPSSLWSLSDAEVEKKEWNRQNASLDREEIPCSSSFFDGCFKGGRRKNFEGEFEEDRVDDDDEGSNNKEEDKEDWDIRSSIGLDSTLDNEDEEDEFDMVAVGKENAGELIFMKDVTEHGAFLNSHNVLPKSIKDHHTREPLTDRFSSRKTVDKDDEAPTIVYDTSLLVDSQVKIPEDGGNLKPILKRKEIQSDLKLAKRVKFNLGSDDSHDQEFQAQNSEVIAHSTKTTTVDNSPVLQYDSRVPDYVRNPSKYTRYDMDSSDEVNEVSNRNALMDFLNMVRKSDNALQKEETADLSKSITFTPKKKTGDTKNDTEMKQSHENAPKTRIGISAVEDLQNEACDMDEDEQETMQTYMSGSSKKPGRQYRSKSNFEDCTS